MKKNRIQKLTAQTNRNQKETFKAKRRAKQRIKPIAQKCKVWEPGPSKFIKYDKDGKVIGFIKRCEKGRKQKDYITNIGKAIMDENKSIRKAKKDLIKSILQKAGYDPTIRYTRKEKKKFTRIVKNSLFVKAEPVIAPEKTAKTEYQELKALYTEEDRKKPLEPVAGKQAGDIAYNLSLKEKPENRHFKYIIERKSSENTMRSYDFLTDFFDAETKEKAFKKAAKIAKKYKNDTSFAGIRVQDINKDNSIIFYSPEKLLAA